MEKGTRVEITGGRQGVGQVGNIFWKGPNKFGSGDRFGVRGDDGATYWVLEDDVVESQAAAPPTPVSSETYAKGDRVGFTQGGRSQSGTVFWTGDSKTGSGQRLGIKTDGDEETVWIDAGFVSRTDTAAPPRSEPSGPYAHEEADSDPRPSAGEYWSAPLDDLPPMSPFDDAALDQMASGVDSEDEGG